MATKPKIQTLNATSADIVNVVTRSMPDEYRGMVPLALSPGSIDANGNVVTQAQSVESLRQIGSVIMNYQLFRTHF